MPNRRLAAVAVPAQSSGCLSRGFAGRQGWHWLPLEGGTEVHVHLPIIFILMLMRCAAERCSCLHPVLAGNL